RPAAHRLGHHRPARRRRDPRPQRQHPPKPDQETRHFARLCINPAAGGEMSRALSLPVAGKWHVATPSAPTTTVITTYEAGDGHAVRFVWLPLAAGGRLLDEE